MRISKPCFFRTGIIVTVLLFTILSCLDERYDFDRISDEIELKPGFAAPLAYGSLTIANILNEIDEDGEFVHEDEHKLLYITYSDKLVSLLASDIVDIPNQDFLELYIDSEFDFPAWIPPGTSIPLKKSQNGVFVFQNNERIDSIFPKNTRLLIEVNSSFRHTGTLIITSPNVIINGAPFVDTIEISDLSGNFNHVSDISLDGSKITLDNSNPDTTYLPLEFTLELVNSGQGISDGDNCEIKMSFVDVDFYAVYGYLGDYDLLHDGSGIGISLFDLQIAGGNLFFFDPQLYLEINNSFGVPVAIELYDTEARSELNDITIPIVLSPEVNPLFINAPTVPGTFARTDTVIDKENSNIDKALETQPNEVFYKAKAFTNPSGPDGALNFVTDTSRLDVDIELVLPLWIRAEGFSLNDTVEFNLEEDMGDVFDVLDYLRITLEVSNGIPLKLDMQVYFTDENFAIIDSMFKFDRAFLEPAELDDDKRVSKPENFENRVEFTKLQLEAIRETKHAIVNASLSTTDADAEEKEYVKFLSDYKIDFNLRIKANFNINSRKL